MLRKIEVFKMKHYIASVTLDGELKIMRAGYNRKQDFYNDLRANGYRVRFISTPENFDADCEKYNERCENNKRIKKVRYASDKESANRMHMTVKEFRAWLKA